MILLSPGPKWMGVHPRRARPPSLLHGSRDGCALALEWKKAFRDEWTGSMVPARVAEVMVALARGISSLREILPLT